MVPITKTIKYLHLKSDLFKGTSSDFISANSQPAADKAWTKRQTLPLNLRKRSMFLIDQLHLLFIYF